MSLTSTFYAVLVIILSIAQAKVIVTGAGGRTGQLVLQKLLAANTPAVGLVRCESSKKKLVKTLKCEPSNVVVADINSAEAVKACFIETGATKLVLCTSAVPKINPFSIVKVLVLKAFGKQGRPEFTFREKGSPYYVDWLGAKNQFDAAKATKMKQVVVVGSMGGTDEKNFLNTIGKKEGETLSGNILVWKRKAEEYLISSGLPYTIIHPGGLIDKPSGEREIVYGNDDELLKAKTRQIPRGDVAEVCVQALNESGALKKSFDIVAKDVGQGVPTSDWRKFFQSRSNKY